jgi:hypothetical protein
MTYVEHVRISAQGSLPGGEQFSYGFALAGFPVGSIGSVIPDNTAAWNTMAAAIAAFHGRGSSHIYTGAVLTKVKFAPIGSNGLYAGLPYEVLENTPGNIAASGVAGIPPNQLAAAVTLHSAGDLGRVKGRFYVPMPIMDMGTDGRWTTVYADDLEGSAKTMINAVNATLGGGAFDPTVVVASQGRHRGGVQVKPPTNYDVVAVSVGRVPDTIRRRRNKLAEGRTIQTL